MTNVTAVAYGDMPLFLFHLLEFMDVDYEIDVDELNDGWAQPRRDRRVEPVHPQGHRRHGRADHRGAELGDLARDAAAHGGIRFRAQRDRLAHRGERGRGVLPAHRAAGGYRYPGADLGILVTRGRLQTDEHELTDRARIVDRRHQAAVRHGAAAGGSTGADPRAGAVLVQAPLAAGYIRPDRSCPLRNNATVQVEVTFQALEHSSPVRAGGALRAPLAALPGVVSERRRGRPLLVRRIPA